MFQIGEEDFSFGDDEDFWSEALELEATTTASNSSSRGSNVGTSGRLAAQNHVRQNHKGNPAAENALQPGITGASIQMLGRHTASVGNALGGSRDARTLQDSNKLPLPTTPGNQAKRKFSFKQKSPRGSTGPSIPSATTEAIIDVNKRAKQGDQSHTSFNNSNLKVVSDKPGALQDLSKNIQTPSESVGNLRAPNNQISGALRLRQPLANPNGQVEIQGQGENSKGELPQFPQWGTNRNLPDKTGVSTLRNGPDYGRGQTSAELRVPGQQPCTVSITSKATEGLPFEVGYNFEEEINLSEDDFNWDPVIIPSSTIVTANVTQSVSTLRSVNQLNQAIKEQRPSNSFRNNCTISKPSSVLMSPAVGSVPGYSTPKLNTQSCVSNPQANLNQQRPNVILGGTSTSMDRQNISPSGITSSCQVSSTYKATPSPRFSSSHSGQSPSNFAQKQSQQFQGNPARMNFQPRSPSLGFPTPSTQYLPRSNAPMRAGTPGYTSPSSNFQGRGPPQQGPSSTPRTPNIRTPNSTSRQLSTPVQRFNNSTNQHRYSTTQGDRPFTTHGAKTQNRGMSNPQTPLLTSRVAQLFQTPNAGSSGPSRTRVRKFPGPAGVLPKLAQGQKLNDIKLPSPENHPDTPGPSPSKPEEFVSSQDLGDTDFSDGAWQTMKTDLGLEEDNPHSVLAKNTIALVLRKASLKQLTKNKVPNLCVLIKAVTFNAVASVVLRDPTGEMQGTVHRRLVEEHQGELKPGSVLVLRQVGVLSPSLRNHYLNITPSNLIQIYPNESSTLSQSSQRTPKSRTTRSSRRPSGDALHLEADLDTPKRSGSLELSRRPIMDGLLPLGDQNRPKRSRTRSLEKHSPDPAGGERDGSLREASPCEDRETLPHERTSQSLKRSRSSELKRRSDSGGSRIGVLEGGGSCDNFDVSISSGSDVVLDKMTTHADVNHRVSNKSSMGGETTLSNRSRLRKDNTIVTNKSCHVMLSDDLIRAPNGLDSKETRSSKNAPQKSEDFTELLADIGDDFFEDF